MKLQKTFSILLVITVAILFTSCGIEGVSEDSYEYYDESGKSNPEFRGQSVQSQGILEESVFIIRSNKINVAGSGFIVSGNILVTNFHVINLLVDENNNAGLNSIYIRNAKNEVFYIKRLLKLDILSDLALLEVENYTGGELLLSNSSYEETENMNIAGFKKQKFEIIDTTTKTDIDKMSFSTLHLFGETINGISGGPVINEKREVVGIVREGSNMILLATKKYLLEEFLNEIPNLEANSKNIFEIVRKEKSKLEEMAQRKESKEVFFRIGYMYLRGNEGFQQNFEMAFYWLVNAAKRGHVLAQFRVGSMFVLGQVEQSFKNGMKWYLQAATPNNGKPGYARAQSVIGIMLLKGNDEIEANPQEAVYWLTKAASQGDINSKFILGSIDCFGIENNIKQYFEKSAEWPFDISEALIIKLYPSSAQQLQHCR